MIEWFLTTVKAILQVFGTMYLLCMFMLILYWIGAFFDWCEHKRYEKDMNEYLKRKHERENHDYAQDIRMQQIMREWNW